MIIIKQHLTTAQLVRSLLTTMFYQTICAYGLISSLAVRAYLGILIFGIPTVALTVMLRHELKEWKGPQ